MQALANDRRRIAEIEPGAFRRHAVGRERLAAAVVEDRRLPRRDQVRDVVGDARVVQDLVPLADIDRRVLVPEVAPVHRAARAFSGEVDTGSPSENAANKRWGMYGLSL